MIIMLNCITIGVQTNMRNNAMFVISLMDFVFTWVFLIEVILRSMVFGWKETIFGGVYKFLDFLLIIITGVLISWILEPLGLMGTGGVYSTLQVLRVLRLIRIIRVVRSIPL